MDKSIYGIYNLLTKLDGKGSFSHLERDIFKSWIHAPIMSTYNALIWVLTECDCDKYDVMSAIHRFEKERGFDDYGCTENFETRPLVRLQKYVGMKLLEAPEADDSRFLSLDDFADVADIA